MNRQLLFVDDDPGILRAIERQLRTRYDVETATSSSEGLRVLAERGPFAVAVADMHMPGMDGVQFLSQVRETAPDTVRLMMTGFANLETAIEAVNRGAIFRFLTKDRMAETLGPAIDAALEQHRLVTSEKRLLERMEQRVRHLAYFDALTDLPNRTLFLDRLGPALARAAHNDRACAVVCLDLDGFGAINDAYGTRTGDEAIRSVAASLAGAVRDGDTVARMGSDEFGIALIDMGSQDDVESVLDKIERALARPLTALGTELKVTASMGVATCPRDSSDPAELIKKAGIALSSARRKGPGAQVVYSPELGEEAETFGATAARLRRAAERGEYVAHYQPYFGLASGQLVGAEALIRWRTAGRLVPPLEFIPVLEETGLIGEAGAWMLGEVCRQIRAWQTAGLDVVPVAVNLSPLQFRSRGLLENIRAIIEGAGIDPRLLTFEVTESTFMENPSFTRTVLAALRDMGARVSIDDFGTGYSSLAHLKHYAVDHLKIDRAFVRDLTRSAVDVAIVSAIVSMARALGLKTIAEGVETAEQVEILRQLECDMAQGFYFARPLPADEMDVPFPRTEPGRLP